ncbi:MAG: LLM class flavin-dependent oxidoreductase [Deltaproteobacteria bacterium]|nr:LLM class flavin-dependent oxidoreductase [Deltaproteobacteria bacterium]MBI3389836.1 LLM class flavin-dependent oxidoreductase [Deltaproteobacteria bacterium]
MEFFFFHLMPWPHLPADYEGPAWVKCPNSNYDAQRGTAVYNRYLDELIYADELGFDGVCVNEHHANAYGNMPSPNLIASILARQTKRCKIAVVGNALPLYNPPLRVAEEFAMIDVISGGRLIAGMVVGGGPEYYSNGLNPAQARERFYEAHDLIVQAWTRTGPFEFNGKHYKLRYVNPWPTPLQKPHPPIWIPGAGSLETMEFVAKHRYAYMGIPYFHKRVFKRNFDFFREACDKEGYTADPKQMGWLCPIYVADTDEQARKEYESHFWYFAKKLLPGIQISPPGYTSARSAMKILTSRNDFMLYLDNWNQVEEGDYAIVGSPQTVIRKMTEMIEWLGVGNILALLQLGTLPADLTRRNMDLFSREVLPALRKLASARIAEPARVARSA